MTSESHSIDAVVTWVDGGDPVLRKKREQALRNKPYSKLPIHAGRTSTRFNDNGELRYCLVSIRHYMPWIRNIYLVVDDQRPSFLDQEIADRWAIKLVDHKIVFHGFEWALPTFNTRTIETAVWRIPDLAPRFVYFNDDFVVLKPIDPEYFFPDENSVIYHGNWKKTDRYSTRRIMVERFAYRILHALTGINVTMHLLQQIRSAQLAGFSGWYFHAPHAPHPVRRDTLAQFFAQYPQLFAENIRFPFRDASQFSAIFLARHLELIAGSAQTRADTESLMLSGERDNQQILEQKLHAIVSDQKNFVCLQSLESMEESFRSRLLGHLANRLAIE